MLSVTTFCTFLREFSRAGESAWCRHSRSRWHEKPECRSSVGKGERVGEVVHPRPGLIEAQDESPGLVHEQSGHVEDPVAHGLRLGLGQRTVEADHLAPGQERSGDQAGAKQILADLIERSHRGMSVAFFVAVVYAGLEDYNQAFGWLDRAFEERSHWLVSGWWWRACAEGETVMMVGRVDSDPNIEKYLEDIIRDVPRNHTICYIN